MKNLFSALASQRTRKTSSSAGATKTVRSIHGRGAQQTSMQFRQPGAIERALAKDQFATATAPQEV